MESEVSDFCLSVGQRDLEGYTFDTWAVLFSLSKVRGKSTLECFELLLFCGHEFWGWGGKEVLFLA